jgi:hypothetical protein
MNIIYKEKFWRDNGKKFKKIGDIRGQSIT